jgi:hypothetical protein
VRILSKFVRNLASAAFVLPLSLGYIAGPANAVPLQIGQSVTSGGVTFSVIDCLYNSGGGPSACGSGAGEFDAAFSASGSGVGINITGPGPGFGNLLSGAGGQDLYVIFNAVSAGPLIKGITLAVGAGSAPDFDVHETIFTTGDFLAVDESNLTDSVVFATPQNSILFDKDISLNTDGQIDSVTQQLDVDVPEPSGLSVLLLAGAMGLGFRSRRNRTSGTAAKSSAN